MTIGASNVNINININANFGGGSFYKPFYEPYQGSTFYSEGF
jgi:hypothetical protein